MSQWHYFSDAESMGLDLELMAMLDRARGKAEISFTITRGFSTPEQNNALPESVQDSAHLTGHAVDLACADSSSRYKMVTALLSVGFNRIGIYSKHIHADNDTTKPANVIWHVAGT